MITNNNKTVYRFDKNCCFINCEYNGKTIEISDENKATMLISSCIILDVDCEAVTLFKRNPDKAELNNIEITIAPLFPKDESSTPSENKNNGRSKKTGSKISYYYNGSMSPVFNKCIWINNELIPVHLKNNPFITFNACSVNDNDKRCHFDENGVLEIKNSYIRIHRKPDKNAIRAAKTEKEISSMIKSIVDSDGNNGGLGIKRRSYGE